MGLDANARIDGQPLPISYTRENGIVTMAIENERLRKLFNDASEEVIKQYEIVDGGLDLGYLDCQDSVVQLSRMLGELGVEYDHTMLCVVSVRINWDAVFAQCVPNLRWAYGSARAFLRLCVENGLGIEFS